MIRARDVMQTQVITVNLLDPLDHVEKIFAEEDIHGAPVVDERGAVLGIISTSDLVRDRSAEREMVAPVSAHAARDSASEDLVPEIALECASDVMTLGVVRVRPNAPIADVARKMREQQVHRVLVMEEGKVVGLISTFDLLQVIEDSAP